MLQLEKLRIEKEANERIRQEVSKHAAAMDAQKLETERMRQLLVNAQHKDAQIAANVTNEQAKMHAAVQQKEAAYQAAANS